MKFIQTSYPDGLHSHLWIHGLNIMADILKKGLLYKLLFSRGFYFREFREPDPRENFHFNSCLFIVMTTSEKSRN